MTHPLSIEIGLLGFLRGGARHGYAIHQALSDPAGLGPVWRIKLGRLYALLNKLEEAGYLASTTESQGSRPPRKLFQLTAEGEALFLRWIQAPVPHGRALRLEFLIKLYFARLEGEGAAARLLAAQRAQCREWLAVERQIIDDETVSGRRYGRLVHQFRAGQLEAMLSWIDSCQEEMSR